MRVLMTQKEKLKEAIISACCDAKLTEAEAAKRLGVCDRQVRKLKRKFRNGICLKHGNSKKSNKRLSDEFKERIVNIYNDFKFVGCNFLHFKELLLIHHDIKIGYTTLRQILNEAGFKSPKKQKKRKIHKSRPPRSCFGELLQTDASPFQWFLPFGDTQSYSLHGFIDDATGIVTGLHFSKNECLDGYFEAFRQVLTGFGLPESIYADGLCLFFGNTKREPSIDELLSGISENKTQFGKILDSLGIDLIHALSPQAKEKIERLWQTLQSRLVIEFKLHNIDCMNKANNFLPRFLKAFNKQFSKPPASENSLFLPLPKHINLDTLLAKKITRKLDAGLCFSLDNHKFRVDDAAPKSTVEILLSSRLGMKVLYHDLLLAPVPLSALSNLSDFIYLHTLINEKLSASS